MSLHELYPNNDPRYKRLDEALEKLYDIAESLNISAFTMIGYLEVRRSDLIERFQKYSREVKP